MRRNGRLEWFGVAVACLVIGLVPAPAAAADATVDWRTAHPRGTEGYAEVRIDPGDNVTWSNSDIIEHDVIILRSGAVIATSPIYGRGESWTYRFSEAGTYQYYCSVPGHNSTMYGVVQVGPPATDASFPVPVVLAAIGAMALVAVAVARRRSR